MQPTHLTRPLALTVMLLIVLCSASGCMFTAGVLHLGLDTQETAGETKRAGVTEDGRLVLLTPVERRYEFRRETKDRYVVFERDEIVRKVEDSHHGGEGGKPTHYLGYVQPIRDERGMPWLPSQWHDSDATATDLPAELGSINWHDPVSVSAYRQRLFVTYELNGETAQLDATQIRVRHTQRHGLSAMVGSALVPPAVVADTVTFPVQFYIALKQFGKAIRG